MKKPVIVSLALLPIFVGGVALRLSKGSEPDVSLLLTAKAGAKFSYRMNAISAIGERQAKISMTFDMTIVEFDSNDCALFKTVSKDGTMSQGGRDAKMPESVTNSRLKRNGVVVSVDPPSSSPEQARAQRMMQFVVADAKVRVGSKWTWTDPASNLNGKVASVGRGEVVAIESRNGVSAARLSIAQTESSGDSPASAATDVWISLIDGMILESSVKIKNAPFGPGMTGSMDFTVKRV